MRVKFLKLHPKAEIPKKAYPTDFCYDVKAVRAEEIAPNVWKYWLGFALQMDKEGVLNSRIRHAIDFRPRSSVWEHGMVLSNSPGTGDEHYTGEYSLVFYHVFPDMPRYEVGDKVGQMCISSTVELDFDVVDALSPTDRSDNGYGSSGR